MSSFPAEQPSTCRSAHALQFIFNCADTATTGQQSERGNLQVKKIEGFTPFFFELDSGKV